MARQGSEGQFKEYIGEDSEEWVAMGWSCGKNGRWKTNWQRVQMAGKWRDKRRGEDRECDGRTAL